MASIGYTLVAGECHVKDNGNRIWDEDSVVRHGLVTSLQLLDENAILEAVQQFDRLLRQAVAKEP